MRRDQAVTREPPCGGNPYDLSGRSRQVKKRHRERAIQIDRGDDQSMQLNLPESRQLRGRERAHGVTLPDHTGAAEPMDATFHAGAICSLR